MKWMTREKARVDRIACPWLITRFIDPQAEFLFVPAEEVMADPALQALAPIVRGADTGQRQLTPESPGLYAVASGFRAITKDDFENMARQFAVYDALYAYCQDPKR